jgi:hypothetical protein
MNGEGRGWDVIRSLGVLGIPADFNQSGGAGSFSTVLRFIEADKKIVTGAILVGRISWRGNGLSY